MRQTSESNTGDGFAKSHRHLIPAGNLNFQDGNIFQVEKLLNEVKFIRYIYKQSNKPRLFVNCLVEFGCEALLPHFILHHLVTSNSKFHIVFLGWKGREYFYKDYADEFWEIDSEYMFLRDYVRAFTNVSKNIRNIEESFKSYGTVFSSKFLGNYFLESCCSVCKAKIGTCKKLPKCPKCGSIRFINSLFADLHTTKNRYRPISLPRSNFLSWAKSLIKKPTIAIFARNRKTYGRNLPEAFYIKMIESIRQRNYEVIWLGEKTSSLDCPVSDVFELSRSEYADNLEACTALVSLCKATFQAWTASTRFSQITNTPFFLVESPDQIYGNGQEGKRLYLLTQDLAKKKIFLSNYIRAINNLDLFMDSCLEHLFDFITNQNSNDVIGFVNDISYVNDIMKENKLW